jgi:hypothetical protein
MTTKRNLIRKKEYEELFMTTEDKLIEKYEEFFSAITKNIPIDTPYLFELEAEINSLKEQLKEERKDTKFETFCRKIGILPRLMHREQ